MYIIMYVNSIVNAYVRYCVRIFMFESFQLMHKKTNRLWRFVSYGTPEMIRTTSSTPGVLHRGLCPLLATPLESVTPEGVVRYIATIFDCRRCNSNGEENLPQAPSRRLFGHTEHNKITNYRWQFVILWYPRDDSNIRRTV